MSRHKPTKVTKVIDDKPSVKTVAVPTRQIVDASDAERAPAPIEAKE